MKTLSVVMLFLSLATFIFCCVTTARRKRGEKILYFTIWLYVSIFIFMLSKGMAQFSQNTPLSGWDVILFILDEFVETLEYFSLSFEPSKFIAENAVFYTNIFVQVVFNITAIIYFIAAPCTSGVIVFQLACEIFPDLKFKTDNHSTKFIFSELNEYTIIVAESLKEKQKEVREKFNPQSAEHEYLYDISITFANASPKNGAEAAFAQYVERAKNIGANCIKKDLKHLKVKRPNKFVYGLKRLFSRFKIGKETTLSYFLFCKDESANVKDAIFLANDSPMLESRWKQFDKVQIRVLANNAEADEIISEKYSQREKKQQEKPLKSLSIQVVHEYTNLVYNLLNGEYPLIYSRFYGSSNQKLSVAVIGGGAIGKQFIKAAYWCGQTFSASNGINKSDLKISLFADNAEEIKEQLKFEMPQAFEDSAKDYCSFGFSAHNFGTDGFYSDFENCLDADYVLINLGKDDLNMQACRWVQCKLNVTNALNGKRPVISLIIENDDLCSALRTGASQDGAAVINAFGCLSDRFGYGNIFLNELENTAFLMNAAYGGNAKKTTWSAFVTNAYNRKSSMASAVHYKYKLASLGAVSTCEEWKNNNDAVFILNVKNMLDDAVCRNKLYYLEHIRWNAYMISEGYRCPTVDEFLNLAFNCLPYVTGRTPTEFLSNQKKELKLHACLLSCNDVGLTLTDSDFETARASAEKFVLTAPKTQNLGEWLLSFANGLHIKENGKAKVFDQLDALSLFVSAFKKKNGKPQNLDYKDYDFTLVSCIYVSAASRKIISAYNSGDSDTVKLGVKALYDSLKQYQAAGVAQITKKYLKSVQGKDFSYVHIGGLNGFDYVIVDDCKTLRLYVYDALKVYVVDGCVWNSDKGEFLNLDTKIEPETKTAAVTAEKYYPNPINTYGTELGAEIDALAEKIAENTHEVWALGKVSQGWKYGKKRNERKKKTPQLVPYGQLSEEEKDYDRRTSQETLKLIKKLGYDIVRAESDGDGKKLK